MSRRITIAVVCVLAVALVGLWLVLRPMLRASAPDGASRTVASGDSVADLMMDLGIIPLDAQPAKAFTLQTLDGKQLSLAELAGRPVLLYFWASW